MKLDNSNIDVVHSNAIPTKTQPCEVVHENLEMIIIVNNHRRI